ncbi:MAG: endopeptidase La [Acidimicrobiia bacterium]
MDEVTTLALPVLPIRNGVLVPHMVVTVNIESEEAVAAIEAASNSAGRVLLLPQIEGEYARIGVVAEFEEVSQGSRGPRAAVVRTMSRAIAGTARPGSGEALWLEVDVVPEPSDHNEEVLSIAREYRALVSDILDHRGMGAVAERITDIDDPGQLADLAVYSPDLTLAQKVELLETIDVRDRLRLVSDWMREILADIEIRERVHRDAASKIDQSQREYLLRRQLEEIRSELGESSGDVASEYREKIAEAGMPESVREAAEREVDRLERVGEQSPEHSWIRTWLDTLLDVPWSERSEERLDLEHAREVLDADHTGLEDPKERIVEHLAVRRLKEERGLAEDSTSRRGSGAILLFVGPPGVGKTSLGESIARALGREFVRVSLGGIHDEAEIRGHRRTYVGARPGRIVRALIESGTMNPVFLLDEMDKVGADWRGDPSAALLEVLDPAQNHTFRDHYLEVDLDLSDVLFVGTANIVETIPAPLLDRTEVIRLDGYADLEKITIARDHLLPRQIRQAGLTDDELDISDEALRNVIDSYTREAGVRGLERQLGKLCRKAATEVATNGGTVRVEVDDLRDYLGKQTVHHDEAADRTSVPGVATGLAVTGAGGDVLFIEAAFMEGDQGLTLTGQLGDVMKESASIALSYVRSHADELDIDPSLLNRHFHVHVPAGAIPKDGPSAGIAMTSALVSLLTDRKVSEHVGMTGEVTLQGRVLPIGGVKQKALAAHRAGLTEVIVPSRNEVDLDEIPSTVADDLTFHTAETIAEVLDLALEPAG